MRGASFWSHDPFLNLGTNNTMDNWLGDRWSVECRQHISTVDYVDNTENFCTIVLFSWQTIHQVAAPCNLSLEQFRRLLKTHLFS